MAVADRGGRKVRNKKPISFSAKAERAVHSCGEERIVKLQEKGDVNGDSELQKLKDEIKRLLEKLSVVEIESNTFRDDFQQERQDRERAVERCEKLQQTVTELESKIENYQKENTELVEQLNDTRHIIAKQNDELEAAREEIAVKVAQVKQYQKQVEAYKQQLDKLEKDEDFEVTGRKRKSDSTECSHKRSKQPVDSAHTNAGESSEQTDSDFLSPPTNLPLNRGLHMSMHKGHHFVAAKCNKQTNETGLLAVGSRSQEKPFCVNVPDDPNLQCPLCKYTFKKGEIQRYRSHVLSCSGFMH